ncbi:MAG: PIN domain protein [Candidatus Nephrothrix sp. EaCA]|nr:MAG: PIN domain protein [Candidatus Nephrothrix sp. EaCA]
MESRRLTTYLDTSVIGGYFDVEFEDETKELFQNIMLGKFEIMLSSTTEDELLKAPEQVKELFKTIPVKYAKRVELTEEAIQLAGAYISENVAGGASQEDCRHIALAAVNKADVLVSWNYKHMVNIFRIRGYNSVNLRLGYSLIDIRSPKEMFCHEN